LDTLDTRESKTNNNIKLALELLAVLRPCCGEEGRNLRTPGLENSGQTEGDEGSI